MTHHHHTRRAWRLITARLFADAPAEHALNREVGESTRDWFELAHALADIVAGEIYAQQRDGRFGAHCRTVDDLRVWLTPKCDDEGAA